MADQQLSDQISELKIEIEELKNKNEKLVNVLIYLPVIDDQKKAAKGKFDAQRLSLNNHKQLFFFYFCFFFER